MTISRATLVGLSRVNEPARCRFTAPNTVIRATAFHDLHGFVPFPCYEDYHLMLRLSLKGRWRHVVGEPVIVRRNLHLQRQTIEPPLSKKYLDSSLIGARALDRFICQEGGANAIPEIHWRRRLAQLWCRAGTDLVNLHRRAEADACFRRTLALQPFHLRPRWNTLLPCFAF